MEWKNIYRGLIMGASDVIPGVSGGTIAVLLGIYDRLISSISGIFSKNWKKHLGFLIPLGIGMAAAVLLLSKVIEWLFEHYPGPTKFFFLGLIIGILPYLFQQADVKQKFRIHHYILLLVGAILISMMIFLQPHEGAVITSRSASVYVLLFFSGMLGSAAMILPGISGSLVLLIIGVYTTVISAISNLQFDVLAVVGLGIICGILLVSRIIQFFLEHYNIATYALIIGLVIGSIVVVFPGWPIGISMLILSVVTFAAGLFVAYILGKVEYKE